jgi:hypothetical protein
MRQSGMGRRRGIAITPLRQAAADYLPAAAPETVNAVIGPGEARIHDAAVSAFGDR